MTAGQSFILGYTDEEFGIKDVSDENPLIIFDDFTTSSHYVDFPFKVKSSAIKLLTLNTKKDNINCAFNVLQGITYVPISHERHWISIFSSFDVLLPKSNDEQELVGGFFKSLNYLITLHHSKSFGYILKEIVNCTLSWEQRKLGEIAERIIRKNEKLVSTLPLTISAQYGLIDQNEFFDKRIASKDVRGYYLIKKGEFAYNKSTSVDAPFGAIKRLDKYKNGVLSTLYILFKIIDDTSTSSDYLVTYYATNLWHRGIQSIAAEGARNHGLLNIAPNDFFETMLSIPLNISEQKKVGDFFISLDHLITLHQLEPYKLIFKAIAYRVIDYAKSKPLSSIK